MHRCHRLRRFPVLCAVLVAVVLVAAGCSGGSTESTSVVPPEAGFEPDPLYAVALELALTQRVAPAVITSVIDRPGGPNWAKVEVEIVGPETWTSAGRRGGLEPIPDVSASAKLVLLLDGGWDVRADQEVTIGYFVSTLDRSDNDGRITMVFDNDGRQLNENESFVSSAITSVVQLTGSSNDFEVAMELLADAQEWSRTVNTVDPAAEPSGLFAELRPEPVEPPSFASQWTAADPAYRQLPQRTDDFPPEVDVSAFAPSVVIVHGFTPADGAFYGLRFPGVGVVGPTSPPRDSEAVFFVGAVPLRGEVQLLVWSDTTFPEQGAETVVASGQMPAAVAPAGQQQRLVIELTDDRLDAQALGPEEFNEMTARFAQPGEPAD